MHARVVEMEQEKGFGKARLASGETLVFDVSVLVLGIPVVGAELEVEVGPSRAGGSKITRAEIVPSWEGINVSCLCLRHYSTGEVELLYLDGRQAFRTDQPIPNGERVAAGATGQLMLERKCGAADFFETRVAGWSVEAIEAASMRELLVAYRELLVDAWETWEDADSPHTADALEELKTDLFLGHDLGIDVDALLTISAYPLEPAAPHSVHDRRAYAPRADAPTGTIRLTRPW